MQAQITAEQLFTNNPLFELLNSSNFKPKNSWRNADQRYDVKCLFCFAIHSDHIKTNNIAPSKKGKTTKLYNLMTCENCGMCYDDRNHRMYERVDRSSRYEKMEFHFLDFVDTNDYEYKTENVVLKEHGIKCGLVDDLTNYDIEQADVVKREKVEDNRWKERVAKEQEQWKQYQEKIRLDNIERGVKMAMNDENVDVWSLTDDEIVKQLRIAEVKIQEKRLMLKLFPPEVDPTECMSLPNQDQIPEWIRNLK